MGTEMVKERLKVRDVIGLLRYGVEWELIGGRTAKKLCNNRSTEKQKEKYMDKECCESPIFTTFKVQNSKITNTAEYIIPKIEIWVSGE